MSAPLPSVSELSKRFAYLDVLRESGATNTYGAGTYLMRDLGLSRNAAVVTLSAWMDSFGDGKSSAADRARDAVSKAEAA